MQHQQYSSKRRVLTIQSSSCYIQKRWMMITSPLYLLKQISLLIIILNVMKNDSSFNNNILMVVEGLSTNCCRLGIVRNRSILLPPSIVHHHHRPSLFPPTRTIFSSSSSSSSLEATTSGTSSSSSSLLESMTVKELRQKIQDSGLNKRGLQSRLKRKQDLIDYIYEQQQHPDTDILYSDDEDDDDDDDDDDIMQDIPTGMEIEEDEEDVDIPPNEDVVIENKSRETQTTGKVKKKKKGSNVVDDISADDDETSIPRNDESFISERIARLIPISLQKQMRNRGIQSLLPSQDLSFERIQQGRDTVIQSPTGSGKTLAYILPLLSRNYGRRPRPQRGVAQPVIITIAPSRELARQVGKEWSKFTDLPVATVFGGVPIERHVALLKHKPFVLVSTPGRLRELVRSEFVDYSEVRTLVLDEADTLLDQADSPDVYAILKDMETSIGEREDDEYQLVLVSATINENVQDFTEDLEISPRAYIRIKGSESKVLVSSPNANMAATTRTDDGGRRKDDGSSGRIRSVVGVPTVQHWHMSCKSTIRPDITADLISILAPRLTIIFVPTKTETESVASHLRNYQLLGEIRSLHGDMSQTSRSRTIAMIRESAGAGVSQVLVATDVASRGLDLPNVDLVIQYGIPRDAGKDGTYSTELYTHRTGRTGRVVGMGGYYDDDRGMEKTGANAILLYDPAVGEARILPDLISQVEKELKVTINAKPIPSVEEVVKAGYQRTKEVLSHVSTTTSFNSSREQQTSELVQYFVSKLEQEDGLNTNDPEQLKLCLAEAMAAMSNLDTSLSPYQPQYSLLTRSPNDRTIRLSKRDGSALVPPEVTKYCKSLGSGKLGRVVIVEDGSALFDLAEKRARRLLENAVATDDDDDDDDVNQYDMEIPTSLNPT